MQNMGSFKKRLHELTDFCNELPTKGVGNLVTTPFLPSVRSSTSFSSLSTASTIALGGAQVNSKVSPVIRRSKDGWRELEVSNKTVKHLQTKD